MSLKVANKLLSQTSKSLKSQLITNLDRKNKQPGLPEKYVRSNKTGRFLSKLEGKINSLSQKIQIQGLAPGTRRAWFFPTFSVGKTEAIAEPEVARPGAQIIEIKSKRLFEGQLLTKLVVMLLFTGVFSFSASANPGDTTVVTVWNLKKLIQYGNYDTTAVFPTNKRYRKIRMHYILGRYACPGNPQYCGSWDYTTQIYAWPAGKDSVEVARVITPYATDWLSLGRKHDYIIDVTDYANVLDGSTAMRFNYSGYSWGFNITLKIEFIEGVPPMDAQSVTNVYDGYFTYGNANTSIENYLTPKTYSYNATAGRVFLKNSVSGHGSDANGCGEFCSKYYQLKLNNSTVAQKQLWRADCGFNEVYPQTGTWIYDRANWCPGAVVWPIYHDLTTLTTANTNFTVNVDMEPYTISNASGGYNWVSQLIKYSVPNHTLDVSVEDIKSPTSDNNYLRENPSCMNPVIKLKNTGTSAVTSVVFNYGLKNGSPLTHTWTGSLNYLDETDVVFPSSTAILSGSTSCIFEVSMLTVNGTSGDQNAFNNTYWSKTIPVEEFPADFVIKMVTNNSTDTITLKNESAWKLVNENNVTILSRSGLANSSVYVDSVKALPPGCYKFVLSDSGCDGLAWWANPQGGNGSMRLDYINANNSIYTFATDFGCGTTKYFVVLPNTNPAGFKQEHANTFDVELYPNPTRNNVSLKFNLNNSLDISYKLLDITGKVLIQKSGNVSNSGSETIDLSALNNGIYFLELKSESGVTLTKKVIVQK